MFKLILFIERVVLNATYKIQHIYPHASFLVVQRVSEVYGRQTDGQMDMVKLQEYFVNYGTLKSEKTDIFKLKLSFR